MFIHIIFFFVVVTCTPVWLYYGSFIPSQHHVDGPCLSFGGKIVLCYSSTRSSVTPLLTLPLSPLHLFSHRHAVNHPPSPSQEYTSHCDDPVCSHPGKNHHWCCRLVSVAEGINPISCSALKARTAWSSCVCVCALLVRQAQLHVIVSASVLSCTLCMVVSLSKLNICN